MRDLLTGELLDYGPGGRPAGPIAAEGTPFARLRNGLHRFGLAGRENVDAAAQEVARSIEEALPAALGAWPDKERLLPLQQMQTHLADLRYHSDWKGAMRLLLEVRNLLPELIDRARIAGIAAPSKAERVPAHRGTAKKLQRMDQLRQLLADPEWAEASQAALASRMGVSERTLRNYLDEIEATGK